LDLTGTVEGVIGEEGTSSGGARDEQPVVLEDEDCFAAEVGDESLLFPHTDSDACEGREGGRVR
jgi:hypothetical protein